MEYPKIIIKSEEFSYVRNSGVADYDTYYTTHFFKEFATYTRKKWYLFGEIISYKVPISLFEVQIDIEDPSITKDKLKKYVYEQYDKYFEYSERKKEIESGKIIL